jgi:hypothetical protein
MHGCSQKQPVEILSVASMSACAAMSPLTAKLNMSKKQSSGPVSTLASKVLSGAVKPTSSQAKTLAASVLSQDEKKGNGKGGK